MRARPLDRGGTQDPDPTRLRSAPPPRGGGVTAVSAVTEGVAPVIPNAHHDPIPHYADRRYSTRLSRHLRSHMTPEELIVWHVLRHDFREKFRRQTPLGPYIVDFLCFSHRMIIEVDGVQHAESPADVRRDDYLRSLGFEVMRVWNWDVRCDMAGVKVEIEEALQRRADQMGRPRGKSDPPPPAPPEPGTPTSEGGEQETPVPPHAVHRQQEDQRPPRERP